MYSKALEDARSDVLNRIERLKVYRETYSQADWIKWCEDLAKDLDQVESDCDSAHDDCYNAEQMQDYLHEETEKLRKEIDELQKKTKRKPRVKKAELEACETRLMEQYDAMAQLYHRIDDDERADRISKHKGKLAEWRRQVIGRSA